MRYSPILLGGPYDIEHHLHYFEAFATRLAGSTKACRISFLDLYPKIAGRMAALGLAGVPDAEKAALALRMAELGAAHGIEVSGCGDAALDEAGLASTGCIDGALVERIAGVQAAKPQGGSRPGACRCAPSVDIGTYDTCANGCVYCYANPGTAHAPLGAAEPWRLRRYDPASPMLCDELGPDDVVVERAMPKLPTAPPRLF